MYKILALFSVFALAGAGCSATTNTTLDTDFQPDLEPIIVDENEPNLEDNMIDIGAGVDVNVGSDVGSEVDAVLNMNMDSGNFFFTPDSITAKAGQTVNVKIVSNEGFHTFVIDEIDLKQTVKAGETITFTAPSAPGSYVFYCDVGSHQAMGMYGTLVITE